MTLFYNFTDFKNHPVITIYWLLESPCVRECEVISEIDTKIKQDHGKKGEIVLQFSLKAFFRVGFYDLLHIFYILYLQIDS